MSLDSVLGSVLAYWRLKKLLLILCILAFLAIAVMGGLIWYANRYVQSAEFKDKLVKAISDATGGTVQIDTLSVSLANRFEMGGIKFEQGKKETGSRAFSTKKISVKINLWALLRREIE